MSNSVNSNFLTPSQLITQLNSQNSSLAQPAAATSPNSPAALQNQFLTMLTAQLQNQDPTNPTDPSQITTEMAQLSQVSGISQLEAAMTALSSSITASQTLSATSIVGSGVLVPGSSLSLSNGQAVGGVTLTQPADNLTVTVKDSTGNTVATLNLGAQKQAGVVPFNWTGSTDAGGTASAGNYTFTATATLSGTSSNPSTLSYGTVNAVTPGTNGVTLSVGQLGNFALSSVAQVL
jgi:flagellar basal-body rod modification protein FlgD